MTRACIAIFVGCLVSSVTMAQVVNVSTATQLQAALNAALPGQTIQMADGTYTASGGFIIPKDVNGTAAQPITLLGSRNAILTTGDSSKSNALWLKGNQYWFIKNFTVRKAKKGIMVDTSFFVNIDNILVKKTGEEGIHLRTYSSYNFVVNCMIDSTGLHTPDYGEGIYVGSAVSNWPTYTYGNIDTCNYNKLLNNQFGSAITAENIDIKEGTTGGVISGNSFNGVGLNNTHFADSWVDMKGNYYLIQNNTGHTTYTDGFQTHINYPGFGNYNTFEGNTMILTGAPGYGIRIQTSGSNGSANGNKVCTGNTQAGAALGLTNVSTNICAVPLATSVLQLWNATMVNGLTKCAWTVSSTSGIDRFIVEGSADGNSFSELKIVYPFANNYTENLQSNHTYVRLKIKVNGSEDVLSNVIKLNATADDIKIVQQQKNISIFNPFSNSLFYKVIDANGRMIKVGLLVPGLNSFAIENASAGLHVIHIRNEKLKTDTIKKILL